MPDTTTITGIEQGRAKTAYKYAQDGLKLSTKDDNKEEIKLFGKDFEKDDKYGSHVQKIPMLIKTNGLGATIAFIFSKRHEDQQKKKKAKAYDLLYLQITDWLKQEPKHLISAKLAEQNGRRPELAEVLVTLDSATYRAVTVEVLALFTWLRRFAEGLIKEES